MTKSSKKLTAFGIALALAILIGGFLLHTWGRTKSELTVTKVDLSNNSIYATAPNQLYGTDNCYLIQGASEYLKGNIQLSQIEEGEKIVVDSNGKVLLSDPYQFDSIYSIRLQKSYFHALNNEMNINAFENYYGRDNC